MLKIKEAYGFNLYYDEGRRRFILTDTDGTEVGYGNNQDEAETKAKALSKREFKRIKIFLVRTEGQVILGELTSLNRDEPSAWVSMEQSRNTWGSGREKISLKYDSSYYEATEPNMRIAVTIKQKRDAIDQTINEIDELIKQLEHPINQEYFGIPTN